MQSEHEYILTIAVPTFNRVDFIKVFLLHHLPIAKKNNVQIVVSDNSSTDGTRVFLSEMQDVYPNLKVIANQINIGPERNFELAISASDGGYVWLAGDTYVIPEEGMRYINSLVTKPDFLVFNLTGRVKHKSFLYEDTQTILSDIGGLMSCMSCLVYKKGNISKLNYKRYYDSYFMHTGIILDYFALEKSSIGWVNEISVDLFRYKNLQKNNWSQSKEVLSIAAMKWFNFVFSLPCSYPAKEKIFMLKMFNEMTGLFKLKGLFNLRAQGLLSYGAVRKYWPYLKAVSNDSIFVPFVLMFPEKLLKAFRSMYKRYW